MRRTKYGISLMILLLTLTVFAWAAFAAVAEVDEVESENPDTSNNAPATAQVVSIAGILTTSDSVRINGGFFGSDDTADYYVITPKAGYAGQLAVTLRMKSTFNNFDLALCDVNGTPVYWEGYEQNPCKNGIQSEMVKTPKTTGSTKYYIRVTPRYIHRQDYANAGYTLEIQRYMAETTVTAILSPSTLNSKSNVWSPNANYTSRLQADQYPEVIAASVQALKHATVHNTLGNELRVKVGNSKYQDVTWKSGAIPLSDLVDANPLGTWSASFKATELPVIINRRLTYLGIVSMNTFKITIRCAYDRFQRSRFPYNSMMK